jgi:hypothetical protein
LRRNKKTSCVPNGLYRTYQKLNPVGGGGRFTRNRLNSEAGARLVRNDVFQGLVPSSKVCCFEHFLPTLLYYDFQVNFNQSFGDSRHSAGFDAVSLTKRREPTCPPSCPARTGEQTTTIAHPIRTWRSRGRETMLARTQKSPLQIQRTCSFNARRIN